MSGINVKWDIARPALRLEQLDLSQYWINFRILKMRAGDFLDHIPFGEQL